MVPKRCRSLAVAAALAVGSAALAQCPPERLVAPVGWENGSFATRVQIEGDVVVVGEPSDHTFCPVFTCSSGAVHVFRRAGSEWSFEQTVFSSRISDRDGFGSGIAMDGPDRFAAGAPNEDAAGSDAGAVYIFEHDGESWNEMAEILPVEPAWQQWFGIPLALRGDTLVVGEPMHFFSATVKTGAAWVYRQIDGRWEFAQKLVPPDPRNGARFGNALAMDGEWLMVGARLDEEMGHHAGAVYIYRRDSSGSFTFVRKLVAPGEPRNQVFGDDVALGGQRMVIGAPNGTSGVGYGAAYVYELDGGEWRHVTTRQHDDAGDRDHLGSSVSLRGDVVVAGAPDRPLLSGSRGAAYVFHRRADGSWRQAAKLVPGPDSYDFGSAVATDGASAIVGAPREYVPPLTGAGAAHIFDLDCLLCRVDLDGDGELTFLDFLAFQTLFAAGDLRADFDGDGTLTFFDFLTFQVEFAAGCA